MQRIFKSADFLQPSSGKPIRSVVTSSAQAVIVAWHVAPGQRVEAHVHPHVQDTWTVLSGRGDYVCDSSGRLLSLAAGDIAVAPVGAVHGVHNPYDEALIFISVVTPEAAGYREVTLS